MDQLSSWIHFCAKQIADPYVSKRPLWRELIEEFRGVGPVLEEKRIAAFLARPKHYILPIGSPWYPAGLLGLAHPPLLVFAVGNLELLRKPRVAIVGTRRATPLGMQRTHFWAKQFVKENGWVVVSGLALGVDQCAHQGAFPETVGVLAFGHDHHYPLENKWLRKKMEQNGGLTVSTYLPWCASNKYFFLQRNEVIAALSSATVVMEAPTKSGALYTGRFAASLGHTVYAVPGNPEQMHYAGNLALIQEGAWPLLHPEEVALPLADLPTSVVPRPHDSLSNCQ